MLVTDPRGGEGTPFVFGLAAWSVAALNVAGVVGLVYTFATSFWKEKGAALVGWVRGWVPKRKTHRGRRESNMELLASDYSEMDDDRK